MSDLLREYIKSILRASVLSEASKQPESLSNLCKLLSSTSGSSASPKRGAVNWSGSLEDLDSAVKGVGLSLVTTGKGIKTSAGDAVTEYTRAKNAVLAYIRLESPIKIDDKLVKIAPVIVKPDSALVDPDACKSKLKGGTALGYGVEHAIYSALKGTNVKSMIDIMTTQDARLVDLLDAAKRMVPEAYEGYLKNVATMRSAILQNKAKIGDVVITGPAPGGGTSEYDIEAVGKSAAGKPDVAHKYVFHAKYKSDRLVGIPQASGEDEAALKVLKKQISKELADDNLPLPVSSNSSIAFKTARDTLLFGGPPPKKSIDRDVLADGPHLTSAGKVVRRKQTSSGEDEGVAEINVIMRDSRLRAQLLQNMKAAGFNASIERDIKRQLGIELKPRAGEEAVKKLTSVFINFLSVEKPDIFVFKTNQGADWRFELVPGETARLAFFVTAIKGRERIENALEIELGSIKRAKYVQVHKGKNFHDWLDALSEA